MSIGPNFSNELAAVGLISLPMAWTPDGTISYNSVSATPDVAAPIATPKQQAAVAAVLAAHDPNKPDLTKFASVTSSGTPNLNGVYALDTVSQQKIIYEALYIQTTGGAASGRFSNGQSIRGWPDSSGTLHTFNTTQFINFSEAIASYVDAVLIGQVAVTEKQTPTWPTPITIP